MATRCIIKKIKIYDIEGEESIRRAIRQAKKSPNLSDDEKNEIFEESWSEIEIKLSQSFNRSKESDTLFRIINDHYKANLLAMTGGLPIAHFPMPIEMKFDSYLSILVEEVQKYYSVGKAFEYSQTLPALVLQGGKGDVKFKYFDIRDYFEERDAKELLGIEKNTLYKIWDVEKLIAEIAESDSCRKNYESNLILKDVAQELLHMNIYVSKNILQSKLDQQNSSLWTKLIKHLNFFNEDKELGETYYIINKPVRYSMQDRFMYIIPHLITSKYIEYEARQISIKVFFEYVLKSCVKWRDIDYMIKGEMFKIMRDAKLEEIERKFQQDLKFLNIKYVFPNLIDFIYSFCFYSSENSGISMDQAFSQCSETPPTSTYINLCNQRFFYIKTEALKTHLRSIENYSQRSNYFQVATSQRNICCVKQSFRNIFWLQSYSRNNYKELLRDTVNIKPLAELVFNDLEFTKLVNNIYRACISKIKLEEKLKLNSALSKNSS